MQGIVTRAYGGFYYVSAGGEILQCTLRGLFRHRKVDVLVGDRVSVKRSPGGAVVEEVFPRTNCLVRPPVANVDRAVIVFAVKDPDPSMMLLDRFLIHAGVKEVRTVICLNKIDLVGDQDTGIFDTYVSAGYTVLRTSAKNGLGVADLRKMLQEGVTLFAGPSGVGKSSLLNAAQPGLSLKTGEIGEKIRRGKHTTRHVELIRLPGGGLVADTPGFSSLFLPAMKREELCFLYPEMERFTNGCRFSGCLHRAEPGCAVKEAVAGGEIDPGRYSRYLEILSDLIERERSY